MTGVTAGAMVRHAVFFPSSLPVGPDRWPLGAIEAMVPVRSGGRPAVHPRRRPVGEGRADIVGGYDTGKKVNGHGIVTAVGWP